MQISFNVHDEDIVLNVDRYISPDILHILFNKSTVITFNSYDVELIPHKGKGFFTFNNEDIPYTIVVDFVGNIYKTTNEDIDLHNIRDYALFIGRCYNLWFILLNGFKNWVPRINRLYNVVKGS